MKKTKKELPAKLVLEKSNVKPLVSTDELGRAQGGRRGDGTDRFTSGVEGQC